MHNSNDRRPRDTYRDRVNPVTDRTVRSGSSEPKAADYDYNLVNQTPDAANGGRVNPTYVADREDLSYRDGYVRGKVVEQRYQDAIETRDNSNAARGLLLGILLTSLVGAIVAAFFVISQQNRTPVPVVVPAPEAPEAVTDTPTVAPTVEPPTQTNTEIRERVIERTRELVPVPVPQPQAPAPAPQQQAPAVQQPAPEAQPVPVEPQAQTEAPEVTEPTTTTADPNAPAQ